MPKLMSMGGGVIAQEDEGGTPVKWLNFIIIRLVLVAAVLWTAVMSIVVLILFPLNAHWGHNGERLWARGWCVLFGIRLKLIGAEHFPRPPAAAVLAPNHSSMFDILVMSTLPVDFKYIAKRQVSKLPILGLTLRAMGTYWVDRDKSGKDIAVMKRVEDGLKSGVNVMIFPEGTRSRTGELLPFKKGAFRTAIQSGAPLCPIGISGTYAIAPPGKLPSRRGHDVVIRVGPPLHPQPGQTPEDLMEQFRSRLQGLLERGTGGPVL